MTLDDAGIEALAIHVIIVHQKNWFFFFTMAIVFIVKGYVLVSVCGVCVWCVCVCVWVWESVFIFFIFLCVWDTQPQA